MRRVGGGWFISSSFLLWKMKGKGLVGSRERNYVAHYHMYDCTVRTIVHCTCTVCMKKLAIIETETDKKEALSLLFRCCY